MYQVGWSLYVYIMYKVLQAPIQVFNKRLSIELAILIWTEQICSNLRKHLHKHRGKTVSSPVHLQDKS
jgi:hypothetical protein